MRGGVELEKINTVFSMFASFPIGDYDVKITFTSYDLYVILKNQMGCYIS